MKFKHKVMSKMFDEDRAEIYYIEKCNQSVLSLVPVVSRKYFNLFSLLSVWRPVVSIALHSGK